jgi:hypothetical protein
LSFIVEQLSLPLVTLGDPEPYVLNLRVFHLDRVHASFLGAISPVLRIS